MPGRSGKLYKHTVTNVISFEIEANVLGNSLYVAMESYRYGFNGIENDAEWGIYAAEYQFFDSRLGRWLSPDPIFHPHMSPYVGMDDNPVALCDPYGLAAKGDKSQPSPRQKNNQSLPDLGSLREGLKRNPPSAGQSDCPKDPTSETKTPEQTPEQCAEEECPSSSSQENKESGCNTGDVSGTRVETSSVKPANLRPWVGTVHYYRLRHEDFKKRFPDKEPPSYYLNYGNRYMMRFKNTTRPNLTSQGQEWLDGTFYRLQDLMEKGINANHGIEENEEEFTKFAFNTHVPAYTDYWSPQNTNSTGGILPLHPYDKVQIMLTVNPGDLVDSRSQKQIQEIFDKQLLYWETYPFALTTHLLQGVMTLPLTISHITGYATLHGLSPLIPASWVAPLVFPPQEQTRLQKLLKE